MNILEAEDIIKGLPDQALFEEAQMPSGQVPQFLVVSEIQRRSDMRKRFQEQQPNQGTVKDQIVQQGIMGAMPPQMPTPMPTGMPAQGMFNGGIIRLRKGGFLDREFTSSRPGPYNRSTVRESIEDALARGASMADLLAIFRNQPEAIDLVKQLVADRQRASFSQYNPPLEEVAVDAQRRQPDMGLMSLSSAMQERPEFAYPQLQEVSVDAQRIEPMVQPSASTFATMPKMSETIPPLSLRIADSLGFFDDMKEDARQRNAISNLPAEPMASAIANKLVDRYMVSEDDFATARQVAQLNPAGRYAEQLASMRLPEGAGSNIPEVFQSGRDAKTKLTSLPSLPEGCRHPVSSQRQLLGRACPR